MDYVLVSDECDDCRYTENAFTLLRLPLKKIAITELKPESLKNTHAVIVCKTVENENKQHVHDVIDCNDVCLISWNDPLQHRQHIHTPIQYLKMPFTKYELNNALVHCPHRREDFFKDLNGPVFDKLVGQSEKICKIKSMIKQVAYSDTTVLILGPSGTGKDIIASCIHNLSNRKDAPLVPINCGAIPSELMESELFGHEKGAFTGALTRRPGRFEMANKGTLFLDEIGDMPLPMQVKLLRVIQERKVERVGGNVCIDVDVRLIAATNKNLEELIANKQFREDFYYRLNVFPIHVPSLSERSEDIALIIDHHLDKIHERLTHRVEFTERAKNALCEYTWPGNIRELQNFLERMVILYPDQVVDEKNLELAHKEKKSRKVNSGRRVSQATA